MNARGGQRNNAPRRARSPLVSLLRAGAIALIGAEVLYLAAANVMLGFGAVQAALAATDTVKVDFATAWSPWPGRVYFRDAVVRVQDRNVQFVLELPRAGLTVALGDLLRRTFHATRVRADDVSFRMRHRIAPEAAGDPRVVALPKLAGFSDPPLVESGPPEAPLTDANDNRWAIHLENVDVNLRELWTHVIRYEGSARARGAFWLRPARRLWVGPATLDFEGGTLTTGPHTAMTAVRGELACTVDPFDVEPVHGMDVFRFVSARLAIGGHLPGLSAPAFLARGESGAWSVEGGAGTLNVRTALERGRVDATSEAHYRSDHLRLGHRSGYALGARVSVALRGPTADRTTRADVSLERVTVGGIDAAVEPTPVELGGFAAWATSSSVDASQPWNIDGAGVAIAAARIADLSRVLPLLPKGTVQVMSGEAHARGQADRDQQGAWRGSASLELARATVERGEARAGGDAKITATFASRRAGASDAAFTVEVPRLVAQVGGVHVTSAASLKATYAAPLETPAKWTADLAVAKIDAFRTSGENAKRSDDCLSAVADGARFRASLERPERGDAGLGARRNPTSEVDGEISNLRVASGDFAALLRDVRVSGRSEAGVDGPRVLAARIGVRGAALKSGDGAPRSWQADIPYASAEGHLDAARGALRGPLRLAINGIAGKVGNTTLSGDVEAALRLAAGRPTSAFRLSGDVQARKVAFVTGTTEVSNWWANLRVSDAEVHAGGDVDLTGEVQASLQNALPLMHLLTSNDDIPPWLPAALPLENLSMVLDVERYCRLTDVRIREAKGGPLVAEGRFQLQPGDTTGAVLVTMPALIPISVGFDVAAGRSGTSSVVGPSWLADHVDAMDAALAAKRAAACRPAARQCR